MPLSNARRKQLKKLAHHRKVIVIVGQHGLTDNVLAEIDSALEHHELVKVRINAGNRDERQKMIQNIAEQSSSEVIQTIGHTASFYRQAKNPVITFDVN
jgi:RNA-binding protein